MSDDQQTPPAEPSAGGPAAPAAEPLSAEELREVIRQDTRIKLDFVCGLFAPRALQQPEQLDKLAEILATQQMEVRDRVMPTILDPKQVQINARFGVKLHSHVRPTPFVLHGPKRLNIDAAPDELLAAVAAFALALAPEWRGLLMLYGVRVEFIQANDPGRPRIQLVKDLPRPKR